MIYDLKTNGITGKDIQEDFSLTSPDEVTGIISDLVDRILAGDFEAYWNNFSYAVHGGSVDPRPVFFCQYLEYIKQERNLQNILSPNDINAVTPPDTVL